MMVTDGNMKIMQFTVGPVMTNCYLLINGRTNETLIVDPGAQADLLISQIQRENLKPAAILLTHGHFDHVGAVSRLKDTFDIPVYIAEAEKQTLSDPQLNLTGLWTNNPQKYQADHFLQDGDEFDLAGFHIKMLLTPGHTPGGCCYYFKDQKIVASGDTLFCGSVGRSDLPGGSMSALLRSIRERLMMLPDDTRVLAGHNSCTTIGTERRSNPYL